MITRKLLLLSCLLTAAACLGDDASPPDQRPVIDMATPDQGDAPDMALDMEQPGPPASLAVDPASLDLEIGASTRLTLTILDAAGREVAAQDEVGWSSDDERVAVVDAPGDVLALGPGSTTLRARLGALEIEIPTRVRAPQLGSLQLLPPVVRLSPGMRFELLPALSDAQGRQLSPALYTLSWASDMPAVATVDAAGEVTAVGGGTATISLTVDGKEATSQVIVSDMPGVEVDRVVITGLTEPTLLPGESLTLSAQALDRAGAPVAGAQIVWSSTQRAVATIDAAGRVSALAEGTTALVASAGGAMAQVTLDVTLDADSVSAGGRHACALVDGRAFCWGDNTRGQLGRGAAGATGAPARAEAGRRFVQIIAGGEHTCGVDEAGRRAVCWGRGDSGQLGQGSQADAGAAQDTGLTRVNALCAGARHTCAVGGEGQVYCWGDNASGQLGLAGGARSAPTLVDATHQWAAIACGRSHTCAALATGEVRCWGDNSRGQIGDQTTTPRPRPTPLVGAFELGVLKAGAQHTCGITSNGTPLCWGANSAGQLGEGTMVDRTAPTFLSAPGLQITALDAGESHACALAMGGSVYCWGAVSAGQLGGASAVNTSVPARVMAAPAAVLVAVGGDTSYIVDVTGDVWGWGAASAGQLGAGQTGSVAMPVRVFGP